MKKKALTQRMYGLVMYQLGATIHAGIQYGHAKDEYSIPYDRTKEYRQWLLHDKTYVILNGGTTNDIDGTLQANIKELERFKVKHATFREPDMNNTLTAVAFLVDERVWDWKKYPSRDDLSAMALNHMINIFDKEYIFLEKQAKDLEKKGIFEFRKWLSKFPLAK